MYIKWRPHGMLDPMTSGYNEEEGREKEWGIYLYTPKPVVGCPPVTKQAVSLTQETPVIMPENCTRE